MLEQHRHHLPSRWRSLCGGRDCVLKESRLLVVVHCAAKCFLKDVKDFSVSCFLAFIYVRYSTMSGNYLEQLRERM